MDPPYDVASCRADNYATRMSAEDHTELVDACLSANAAVVVSGYSDGTYDRLRDEFGEGIDPSVRQSDVAIDIARNSDGSVVVFPALTAQASAQFGDGHLIRGESHRTADRPAIS